MNNNPWQSAFGKLLIASSIIAAIAGFAAVTAFKSVSGEPVAEAASNEPDMNSDEPLAFDEQQLPAPVAEQATTETPAEPAAEQYSYDGQETDQPATESTGDEEGVQ